MYACISIPFYARHTCAGAGHCLNPCTEGIGDTRIGYIALPTGVGLRRTRNPRCGALCNTVCSVIR